MMRTLLFFILSVYATAGVGVAAARTVQLSEKIIPAQTSHPISSSRLQNTQSRTTFSTEIPCNATAVFTVSATHIQPGDNVTFTNSSSKATEYQWSIDGVPITSTTNLSHTFDTSGGYLVELVASNEICSDTAYAVIHVGSCIGNQTVVWYFGSSAGMRFTTTPPTALANGMMETREGCATICDAFGNLLFYSNGMSVWNRVNDTMPGGDNTLGGSSSSTQSALIVPVPGNPVAYYIFTTDATADNEKKGCGYAIVDMSGDNGKGIVTQPFISLQEKTGEKLTAIRHTNGRDIWVIARGAFDDTLYSFLVTSSGIEPPIISTLGITYIQNTESVGAMKVSPTGEFLALANFQENRVEVYPFDRTTGMASNTGSFRLTGMKSCYGVEFSPDGSLLYVGNYSTPFGITQFDLTAGTPAAIEASAVFLPSFETRSIGMLQLGPDGVIYVARQDGTFLGAITHPELPGAACAYTDSAISLQRPSRLGLPGFVQDFVTQERVRIVGSTMVCPSSSVAYTLNIPCTGGGCTWTHRGEATAVLAPDGSGAILNFTSPGTDTLALRHQGECSILFDTLFVTTLPVPVVSLGDDIEACSTASVLLDAGSGFSRYQWQDGSTERYYTAVRPGLYWVTVGEKFGCTASDTIRILDKDVTTTLHLGADTSLCSGGVLVLRAPEGMRRYRWQDNSTEPTFSTYATGIYFVEVETDCGTILRDTILVRQTILNMQASGDTLICDGTSAHLYASGALYYEWSPPDGLDDPTSSHPIASPLRNTTYRVMGIDANGCINMATMTVSVFNAPDFQLSLPDTTAAPGTRIALPLRLSLAPSRLPFYVDNLSISVRFRSSIFQADSLTNGTFAITTGQQEILHIELHDFLLTQQNSTLTTIHGTVYLGDTYTTPLELIDLQLNGCPLPAAVNGSITPDSVCSIALRRIQPLGETNTLLTVSPNPVSEAAEISVTTAEQGEHLLSVYNLQGQLLWRESFRHNGSRNTHTISMETYQLGTGLYQIVLTSPTRVRTQNISIVH